MLKLALETGCDPAWLLEQDTRTVNTLADLVAKGHGRG